MKLYIVRHALASPHRTPGVQDENRDLTEEGIEKMRQSAAGLCRLGYLPELLLSSPLVRARHTAEILLQAFGREIPMKITPELAPSGSRQRLYKELEQYFRSVASLMIVGHQPSLGQIAGEIAWGLPECSLDLKKGGACMIEIKDFGDIPRGTLVSLLTSSALREMAGQNRLM